MTGRIGSPYAVDDAESVLKQELAELHVMYHRQAQPILAQLARLEAMKIPRPVYVLGQWHQFRPEVFEGITGKPAPAPEDPGQRMGRLEHEREQLLHLLRMVRSAAGNTLPASMLAMIDSELRDA